MAELVRDLTVAVAPRVHPHRRYSGFVALVGGPREGLHGPVCGHDLSNRIYFDDLPNATYAPATLNRAQLIGEGSVPVYEFIGFWRPTYPRSVPPAR